MSKAILIITVLSIISLVGMFLSGRDLDCGDFKHSWNTRSEAQVKAQKVFLKNTKDIHGLDRNKDGIACNN